MQVKGALQPKVEAGHWAMLVEGLQQLAAHHELYSKVTTLPRLRTFMEFHVWCVWDFMCLAKALQNRLGADTPYWTPPTYLDALKKMNGIVDEEETDVGPDGGITSHFEAYLGAMDEVGADATKIRMFVGLLRDGVDPIEASRAVGANPAATEFIQSTLAFTTKPSHVIAAVFAFSRERLVPRMLSSLLSTVRSHRIKADHLLWYIKRHIDLDDNHHGKASLEIYEDLTGSDAEKISEAMQMTAGAIESRIRFLDSISNALETTH